MTITGKNWIKINFLESLFHILHNRRIESQREEIAQNSQLSIAAFHSRQLKPQTAEEVISELRQSLNDAEE